MPTIVQFRRGTTAQNNNFTGAAGELSVDTTLDTLRVHDGATQGGFEIVNTTAAQTLSNKTIGSNLVPDTDSAYDLGSASFKWKDLYLSGSTIFLGNAQISASGSSVVLPAGTQIGETTIAALDSAGIRGLFSAAGDLTYNSSTGEFSFDVENVYTQSNFDSDFNTSLDNASLNGTGLSYNSGTNTLSITDTGVSAGTYGSASQVPVFTVNAQGQIDSAGAVSVAGVSSTSWDSATGNLIISTADGGSFYTNVTLDPYSTTDLSEGTNLYYTSARADSDAKNAVSVTDAGGDGSLTYSAASGTFTYTGPSAGEVRAHFSGGTGITITDGTITTADSEILHDSLSGFVANEHIDHSAVSVSAGNGLTGGGDITTTRTLAVGEGTGITVTADAISTNDAEIVHDNLSGFVANEHIDHSGVTLTAGVGLTGGGDLTVSRTFAIDSAEFLANFESSITHDNLTGVAANEHIDHSSVTLTAGNGLTGGGDITTSRSFAVGAGTGVTVNADNVAIGQDVGTSADVTFGSVTTTGNVVVGGDLQVTGTTTTVNAQNLEVADNMIYLNAAESDGSPTQSVDVGWAANVNDDGSYQHVGMFRDATDNKFKVFEGYAPEPDSDVQIDTGHASFSLAPFAARTLEGKYLGADSDIDAHLSGGTGITYSAGSISTNDGQIVHDNLSGFVANEHIDHSSVTITAGSGLTGGGDITTSRTLNIGGGTGITVSADAISTNDAEIVHDNLSGFVSDEHVAHSSVSITAGNGLTGGGTIAATRTLNVGEGTGITVSADAISTNDGEIVHDNLSGFVANEHIDHSTVSITAGNGLTGGGTIAATRTIAVGAGTLIDVTADAVNVDLSELSTSTTDGDGDYFVVVDASNNQRKLTKANINISGFNNDAGYSTTTGTVTSVGVTAGTGLSGGGTVTTSGSISLAVDLSELTDMTATMVGTDEFIVLDGGADRRKAANEIGLSIFSNDAGFTTNTGTVTSVGITAGNLIDVSGSPVTTSGNITVNVDLSELTTSTSNADGDYFVVVDTSNNQKKLTKANINISEFNNDAGFTTNVGDITGVTAGTYLTGGGTSGSVTLNVDATSTNTASKVVARDASGNFQAGTITANLTGTASLATSVTVSANNTTNETVYPTFVDGATGTQGLETDTGLTYNPSTGVLSSIDFNSTSDMSLKENIETIADAADKVSRLRGVNFNWKHSGADGMGVIAQEVEKIIPEVVNEVDGIKKVSYGSMVGLLIEAIKDLQQQVNDLKKN